MLRIAICDDNAEFVQQITEMINIWPSKPAGTICSTFYNGDELVNAHNILPFDIILLDIVMPLANGIEVAREIRQNDKNVKIVFLTSSPEFAVESYTVKANNYLLKPVNMSALHISLDEFLQEICVNLQTITVKSLYSVQKIPLNNIEYVEAQNKHILFTLIDNTVVETTEPLHVHESRLTLADGFFKCHRSYIVNINCIDTYTSREITMQSGCRIPIARSCQKEFESAYFSVIFGKAGEFDDI